MSILNKVKSYLFNTNINEKSNKREFKQSSESITFNVDHFLNNNKFKSILVLTDFEESINSNFFIDCLKNNLKVEIKIKYNIINKRKAKFIVQTTEKKLNNANSSYNDNDVFNELSSSKLDDINESLETIKSMIGSNKMVEFIYLVCVESSNLEDLITDSKEVINIANDNGFILTPCLYNQEKALDEILSKSIIMKQYKKKLIDFDFVKLLPTREKKELINNSDLWVGRTKESKQFLTLPFLETSNINTHTLLLGKTRFGKSTLLKMMILQARIKNYNIILIDPQGEYSKLSKMLFGEVKKVGFNFLWL